MHILLIGCVLYIGPLTLNQPEYPEILTNIQYAPKQLYWTGANPETWLNKPKVAVVGSRKITPYGKIVTARIVSELAQSGVAIISGLAYGVDIMAHQAALAANGVTVAVLPTGLDQIYPAAHAHIAREISFRGTLITEYAAGMEGFKSNFIARNRIVSGLCDVLLITEAAINSGSLHTARFALEQGKTVMAVPGNITNPLSEGCNNLIKSGALPVTSAEDIFFALKLNPQKAKAKNFRGTPEQILILGLIQDGITDQDQLAAAVAIDSPTLASTLTMLELGGIIRPVGGGNWVIS